MIKNTKFRSTAQAVGRVASTLQRFTSDDIKNANISFYSQDLQLASYRVDLQKVTKEQLSPSSQDGNKPSISAIDLDPIPWKHNKQLFTWGVGPYITHRLFNPDLPLSMETGVEFKADYQITEGLKISRFSS